MNIEKDWLWTEYLDTTRIHRNKTKWCIHVASFFYLQKRYRYVNCKMLLQIYFSAKNKFCNSMRNFNILNWCNFDYDPFFESAFQIQPLIKSNTFLALCLKTLQTCFRSHSIISNWDWHFSTLAFNQFSA